MSTCKLRTITQSSVLFSQRSFSQSISNNAFDLNHNLGLFRELWNHPSLLQHFTQVIKLQMSLLRAKYNISSSSETFFFPWNYLYKWAPEHNLTLCIQLFTQMTEMKYLKSTFIYEPVKLFLETRKENLLQGASGHISLHFLFER